jgi:hypothetical protein
MSTINATMETATAETATFSGLPVEIQEMVGPYLTPHDLTCCVLVNKAWHTLFNPYIWRYIEEPTSQRYLERLEELDPWNDIFLNSVTETNSLVKYANLIQSFMFDNWYDHLFGDFLKCCPKEFPQLHTVEINGLEGDDEDIAAFLKLSKCGWKQIIFRSEYPEAILGIGNPSMKVIQEHAGTLEVLRLESLMESSANSKAFQRLLCSAPLLREFYVIPLTRSNSLASSQMNGVEIAREFEAGRGWKCTELEVFRCQIGGIPRPDITRDICDDPPSAFIISGAIAESHQTQRGVYSQLAQLTKLRELVLGCVFYSSHPDYTSHDKDYFRQYQCLSMSLESGLDLLKGLNNLETLGLEDMEVCIDGCEEEEWLERHWPSLVQFRRTDYETDMDHYSEEDEEDEDEDG